MPLSVSEDLPKQTSIALITGDATVLSVFSVGGWIFHRVPGPPVLELARIGLPFFFGYFLVAFSIGALSVPASLGLFFQRSVAAWAIGIGAGVLGRILVEGRPPIATFVYVTMAFTGLLFLAWRGAYWALGRHQ